MVAGMKKTLILIGCLALAGCEGFDWNGAAAGFAAATVATRQPVYFVPPPRAPVSCSISANGRQMWCF
jgi:hypothetical protein